MLFEVGRGRCVCVKGLDVRNIGPSALMFKSLTSIRRVDHFFKKKKFKKK